MKKNTPRCGYKFVEYSNEVCEEIPEEWNLEKLGNHSTLYVPMRDKPKKFGGEIDWLRIEDFGGKYVSHSKSNQKVSLETIKEMKLRVYPVGTVLCSCSATIGACAITTRELITNQTFIGIYPYDDLDKEFLYYYLLTQTKNLLKIASGTTILYISREKFEDFPIIIPSLLTEQQKIASILSNIDNTIEITRKIIEKYEKIKVGLMQKLLTRGIGNPKLEKRQLFPRFLSVEISENWDTKPILKIAKMIMGQSPLGDSYNSKSIGMPLLNGPTEFGDEYPSPTQFTTKPTKLCKSGDILLCVRGSTTGRLNVSDREYCIGRGLSAIRGIDGMTDTRWLYYQFQSLQTAIYNIASGGGSTFPNISKDSIAKIILPFPSLPEQKIIAKILHENDVIIKTEKKYLDKLLSIKKGLMTELLTGRIRVNV